MKIFQIFGIFLLFAGMVCATGANADATNANASGNAAVSSVNVAVAEAESGTAVNVNTAESETPTEIPLPPGVVEESEEQYEEKNQYEKEKEKNQYEYQKELEKGDVELAIEYIDYSREFSIVLNPKSIVVDMYYGSRIYDPCRIQLLYDDSTEKAECSSAGYVQIIYALGEQPKVINLGEVEEAEETSTGAGGAGQSSEVEEAEETEEKPVEDYTGTTTSEKPTTSAGLVKVEIGEIHGIEVAQEVTATTASIIVSTSTGDSAMQITRADGKVVLSTETVSVETEEKIVVDEKKNLLYIESEGTNYQLYLNPDEALKIAEEKGYEPSAGAELVMTNNMPTYTIYAKKPVKFLWFTISEEEVVLSVDQTGKVVEKTTSTAVTE